MKKTIELQVGTQYHVECRDKDGNLRWEEDFHNTVVTAGLNDLLTQYFKGVTYTAAWYMGLQNGTFAAGDVMTSHVGWTEVTAYTGNRQAPVWGSVAAGSVSATALTYTMNGAYTVTGIFLCTAATGTGCTLYGGGLFTTQRSGASGDTLTITPTVSAATA